MESPQNAWGRPSDAGAPCAAGHELALERSGGAQLEAPLVLGGRQALMAPLLASCGLLTFFYFFDNVQYLLLAGASAGAAVATAFLLQPLAQALKDRCCAGRPSAGRLLQVRHCAALPDAPRSNSVAALHFWMPPQPGTPGERRRVRRSALQGLPAPPPSTRPCRRCLRLSASLRWWPGC